MFEALRAGAGGFLLKDDEPTELLHAVRVLDGGDSLLAPSVTRRLIAEFLAGPESRHASLERLEGRPSASARSWRWWRRVSAATARSPNG